MKPKLTEHQEQALLVTWLRRVHPEVLFHSIPNGAQLAGNVEYRMKQINKLKAEGMLPGVSDLLILEPRGKYHACFVEMKSLTGKLNGTQELFLAEAEKRGFYTMVCNGCEQARAMIEEYLSWRTATVIEKRWRSGGDTL